MSQQSNARPRFRRSLLVTAALVPALMLAAPAVAQGAATNPAAKAASTTVSIPNVLPSCASFTLCTFHDSDYQGTRWDYPYFQEPHGTCFYVGNAANDQISSLYNNRENRTDYNKDYPSSVGLFGGVNAGGAYSNLVNQQWPDGSPQNDSISCILF